MIYSIFFVNPFMTGEVSALLWNKTFNLALIHRSNPGQFACGGRQLPMEKSPVEEGTPATNRVRQGITGQGVRYVLAFSLVGAAIALAIVLLAY
jgi:hypothetical protein